MFREIEMRLCILWCDLFKILHILSTLWLKYCLFSTPMHYSWISMDIRISDGFGYGATSMPMDTFVGGA